MVDQNEQAQASEATRRITEMQDSLAQTRLRIRRLQARKAKLHLRVARVQSAFPNNSFYSSEGQDGEIS